MTTALRPYSEYKDSGQPWLGRIPGHWGVRKLRHCGSIVGGSTPSMSRPEFWNGEIPWISPKDMKTSDIRGSTDRITELALEETSIKLIDPPAILLVVRGMILARRVPIAVTDVEVTINQDLKALLPHPDTDARFLLYSLEAAKDNFSLLIDEAGHGTKRLPTERWRELVIGFPPNPEQVAIARFLDHADQKIRRFIHAKRRLIELLNEQKQIVSQRILQRTDTSSPGKRSGIPWLPSVPDNWSVIPLHRAAASLQTGPFGSQLHASDYVEGGRPIVNPSNMKNGRIVPDPAATVDEATAERLLQHILQKHDIVFARRGEMGRCVLVTDDEEGWLCGTGGLRMRPKPGLFDPYFLLAVLSTGGVAQFLRLKSVGTVMDNLNESILHTLVLPLPPLDEQRVIVSQLKRAATDTDSAIQRSESEIGLIREYRTRLVADVVTGKLDVREAAERLPSASEQENPDGEPLDLAALDPEEADDLDDDHELIPIAADG